MHGTAFAAFLICRTLFAADLSGSQISGPYTHENLSMFLVHGVPVPSIPHYVPLKEAMETGKVIVHETKNVNQLAIENVSNEPVYIQGGDYREGRPARPDADE